MKWVEVPIEHALLHMEAHTDPKYRIRVDGQVRSLRIIDTSYAHIDGRQESGPDNAHIYIAARLNRRLKNGNRWIDNYGATHKRLEIPEKYVCPACLTDS